MNLNFAFIFRRFYKSLSIVLHTLAVIVILKSSIHLYRISYLVTIALLLVALHQILAPKMEPESSLKEPEENLAHMEQIDQTEEENRTTEVRNNSSSSDEKGN